MQNNCLYSNFAKFGRRAHTMTYKYKILIVEDEMIIAANISLQLTTLGYEVTGIIPRGEEALLHFRQNKPDIVLLDIQLKGELDGIETAKLMQKEREIPIIYLTANADEAHFNKAKSTNPYAFISKPFKKLDLQRAIELTINRIGEKNATENHAHLDSEQDPFIMEDSIFVRHQDKMVKVQIKDVLYIEAERNYSRIYAHDKEYLLVMTLKDIEEKMPQKYFLRIHRSFIVNISHINEIAATYVVIGKKAIPLSAEMKKNLMMRVQKL